MPSEQKRTRANERGKKQMHKRNVAKSVRLAPCSGARLVQDFAVLYQLCGV
jgi:hypothetical protein